MAHITTQHEWENEMCIKILHLIQNELYLDFRYLDVALSALTFCENEQIRTQATDGICLFYSREQILRVYPKNPLFLNRAYLHSVFHCIFRHLWMRGQREPVIWNLACDITVEWIIDSFEKTTTKRALSLTRLQYYEHLKEEQIPVTAAAIYQDLLTITDPDLQARLQFEFYTDDHRFWPTNPAASPSIAKAGQNWEKIGRRTQQEMEMHGQQDSEAVKAMQTEIKKGTSRRSYRDFLRKFTVLREELQCDYDEFDLNYYSYGLRLYQNMPLIEPLESREVMKISEFVIVIDTSYSTNGALVEKFLEETFQIIGQRDSFFHKSHIRILQCDNQVQSDIIIRSEEDITKLLANFSLIGGGGTDFRPAFAYVDQLLSEGAFHHLKGLLYFTDGKGIYPARRPSYETAFVFIGEEEEQQVPPWAMKINLNQEDFTI
ncbi:MAG: VWA-like domain-containing protein [Lachnospiraceae bacterium]|nr:VWA-like domain-containing protein [Lachnospiraceae bacterium]